VLVIQVANMPTKQPQETTVFLRPGTRKAGHSQPSFCTIAKQGMKRDIERPRNSIQGVNGGDGVAVFDARNVAAEQPCALFEISLRESLLFSQSPQSCSKERRSSHSIGRTEEGRICLHFQVLDASILQRALVVSVLAFQRGFLDLGGRPPLRFFRFACKRLKYAEPRFAIFLPPFRPRLTAAGSFSLAKT
jgi:hypothetical protein